MNTQFVAKEKLSSDAGSKVRYVLEMEMSESLLRPSSCVGIKPEGIILPLTNYYVTIM